jgi:hypothetical protein
MKPISPIVLAAASGMLSPFNPSITPGRLQQILSDAEKPVGLNQGLKISEFCRLAQISRPTLYSWERSNKIRLTRIHRVVRVPYSEAQRILNGDLDGASNDACDAFITKNEKIRGEVK